MWYRPGRCPPQLGPQDPLVGEPAEQRLHRVQHHPLGADRIDRVPLHPHVVDPQLPLRHQRRQIEAQRRDVRRQVLCGLLERHEHARLPVRHGATYQELRRQQRLAAARRATHQRGTSARQPAVRHFVQPAYARACLLQPAWTGRVRHDVLHGGSMDGGHSARRVPGAAAAVKPSVRGDARAQIAIIGAAAWDVHNPVGGTTFHVSSIPAPPPRHPSRAEARA
jgi:hypothetical protein